MLAGKKCSRADESGRIVSRIHEDTPVLRQMAVFDVLVNNADRKGDHDLAMGDGHRYRVDGALVFHRDHKLRTGLWGWIGEALSAEELESVDRVLEGLQGEFGRSLAELLTSEEIASLAALRPVAFGRALPGYARRYAGGSLAVVLRGLRLRTTMAAPWMALGCVPANARHSVKPRQKATNLEAPPRQLAQSLRPGA